MTSRGLDTNVFVRYLARDDEKQYRAACRIIDAMEEGASLVISAIVLCELVWVFESAYGYGKQEIAGVLDKILTTAQFQIHDKDLLRKALEDYRHGKGDFSDYYLGHRNRADGANRTRAFDRSPKDSGLFTLINIA